MTVKKSLQTRNKIWIHREDGSNDLNVCGEYGGGDGPKHFTVKEATELFECIRDAIQSRYPNIIVNPWSDAKPGTID